MKRFFKSILLSVVVIAIILFSEDLCALSTKHTQTTFVSAILTADTTPCKTYISFTNNFKETLLISFNTNKKNKDRWGDEIDETIEFNLSAGKTKKIKVETGDTYKYRSYAGEGYSKSLHSQGIVEAEDCKTVDEGID